MKFIIIMFSLFAFAIPASSAGFFTSVESRADAMNEQLGDKNDYHANLARELADIAVEEKAQHDTSVAKAFMSMAEEHAAQSGGAK
ncbi:MAG: hypothetical protein Q9M17_08360 [Mariprofundus sp.]|nr:hypothetical protein [Mariprofundus sp.]